LKVNSVDGLREALQTAASRHRAELARLVEIPSVSAAGQGITEAADAVAELLAARTLDVDVHGSYGHPVVVASGGVTEGPTLLFYEHYDVQPPEPLEEWTVPPFELTEREGRLYGRGVADTKGHLICRLAAIDAVREVLGADPVRYVFVVEGEEEIGSPNLERFVASLPALEAYLDALAESHLTDGGAPP
jgi:acetylornithine deacetylase/succinyl-diaminopimelate desuccinylase-like protein